MIWIGEQMKLYPNSGFVNWDNATINADNFNVTAEYHFINSGSATINANDFNVIAGDVFFSILVQQSMRITSMLQQEIGFSIGIVQQSMRITSMLQQEVSFSIGKVQ